MQRIVLILIMIISVCRPVWSQSTVQKILAKKIIYPSRYYCPPSYAPVQTRGLVRYDEFHALKVQVHRLEELLIGVKQQGVPGPPGKQGPPGRPGPSGPPGKDAPVVDVAALTNKTRVIESRLNSVIAYLDSDLKNQRSNSPPPVSDSGYRNQPAERKKQHWLTRSLKPLAGAVGTAYAGPLFGILLSGTVGAAAWGIARRKRYPPTRQSRPSRPPPYHGDVIQRDGSSEYVEAPEPEIYREAVLRAAEGKSGVLGDRNVGMALLRWVAEQFAIKNKQV